MKSNISKTDQTLAFHIFTSFPSITKSFIWSLNSLILIYTAEHKEYLNPVSQWDSTDILTETNIAAKSYCNFEIAQNPAEYFLYFTMYLSVEEFISGFLLSS